MNDSKRKLYPALAALGGTLVAGQAAALEIGNINVQSTLGEPLRASIAYALGPNEQLAEYCIALRPASPGVALPSISRATINVGKGLITIAGSTVLREPLATLRLDITCPYTPKISREYMLMIDPASREARFDAAARAPAAAPDTGTRVAAAAAADAAGATASGSRATTLPPVDPLVAGDRLLVQPGHTLSRIVAAVGDRSVDYAEAARRVVDANPAAFVDGDPDRLEAGTWLTIPDLAAATPDAYRSFAPAPDAARPNAGDTNPAAPEPAETPAAKPDAATQAASPPAEPARAQAPEPVPAAAEPLAMPAANAGVIDDTDFLEPAPAPAMADAAVENEAADSEPQDAKAAAPVDVAVPAPVEQAGRPAEAAAARPVAEPPAPPVRRAREPASGIPTFWYWLIGGGTAAIAGLLALFYRSRRPTAPDKALSGKPRPNPLLERVKQAEGIEVEPIQAFTEPDFNLTDDSPTAENPTLDAGEAVEAGFDDDGSIAADFVPDSDYHAHRDVDINLDAVRYDEGDDDAAPVAAGRAEPDARDADDENAAAADGDVDVDLSSGSGFDQGEHTRADENFTFAQTTALDFELPEEGESEPQPGTDVIPPLNIEESSILKSEVLPDDDDDYDVSMILDATKQPDPSDVTEKDLHAVVVDAGDNTLNSGEYTVARDPDFEMLEQDYEDELSATQALNMEIERAAAELAGRIDGDESAPTEGASDYELTQELPTDVAPTDQEDPTAIASFDDDEELTAESAALDEAPEPATDVAPLDDETIDAAIAATGDDEAPTAVAPLDEAEAPTAIAPLDDEEEPTAVAPLDADDSAPDEFPTDVAALEDTSIESQLAHLPGEASAEAANDDPLLDENDATGVNEALSDEITEADKTIEMARDDEEPTIRLSEGEDDTVEMPSRSKNA